MFGLISDGSTRGMLQINDQLGAYPADVPAAHSNVDQLYARPEARPMLPEALLQFGTQSCVAQQAIEALWCEQRRLGKDPSDCALVSPRAAYYAGQRRQHGRDAALADTGSRPRDVWAAMREVGVAYWEDAPLLEGQDALEAPHPDAWMKASDPDFAIDFRHDTVALADRVATVDRILASGHCVGVGLTLDQAFKDVDWDYAWPGRAGPVIGRHMVHIYAFDEHYYYVQNWWRDWGDALGRGRILKTVLSSPETTDFITAVVDLAKW